MKQFSRYSLNHLPPTTRRLRQLFIAGMAVLCLLLADTGLAQKKADQVKSLVAPSGETYRRIHVPVDELSTVFNQDRRGVLLPIDEFETLLDKATKNEQKAKGRPSAIMVRQIDYDAKLVDERIVISAICRLRKLAPGWQHIAFPTRGLSIEKATLGDAPAMIARSAAKPDQILFLTKQAGDLDLKFTFSAPVVVSGSDFITAFGLMPSPAGLFKINLPAGKRLFANSIPREPIAKGGNAFEIHTGGMKDLRLQITDRKEQQNRDALVFATTNLSTQVTSGEVIWQADTMVQPFGKAVDQLTFRVPDALEITNVSSIGLEAWELADDEGDYTAITLKYRQAFSEGKQIRLNGVVSIAEDEEWAIPPLILKNVTSHLGRIAIRLADGLRLQTGQMECTRPTVAQQQSNAPSPERVFAYDFWDQTFELTFFSQEKEREVHAAVTTALSLASNAPELQSVMTVKTYFAPLFEFTVQLPSEWTVNGVQVNNQAVTFKKVDNEPGISEYRIPLSPTLRPGQSASIAISARLTIENWPVENESVTLQIPSVGIPDVSVVEGSFGIVGGQELDLVPQDIAGLDPAHLKLDSERLGYRYQDADYSGEVVVSRRPAHVSAETVSVTRLDRNTLFSHLESRVLIEGGSLRVFKLGLSTSAGKNVRFFVLGNAARIVEQTPDEIKEGIQVWTIRLDRRVKGAVTFVTDVRIPRDKATTLEPPKITMPDAEREHGYIALEADTDQKLEAKAIDNGDRRLQDVDPVDFPTIAYRPQKRIIAAWHYFQPNYTVTIAEKRFDAAAIPTAIGYHSQLKTVIADTGEAQHEARWTFATIGVQSISLRLPADADLWGVLLNGNPVVVRKGKSSYSIPIPKNDRAEEQQELAIFYDTYSADSGSRSHIQQNPPQVTVITGGGEEQPLEMLEQDWSVYYPEQSAMTKSSGLFEPVGSLDNPSFLTSLAIGSDITIDDLWLWKLGGIVIVGFGLALLTRIILWVPKWVRYTSAVVASFAVLLMVASLLSLGGIGGASAPTASNLDVAAGSDMAYERESAEYSEEDYEMAEAGSESSYDRPMEGGGVDYDFNVEDKLDESESKRANQFAGEQPKTESTPQPMAESAPQAMDPFGAPTAKPSPPMKQDGLGTNGIVQNRPNVAATNPGFGHASGGQPGQMGGGGLGGSGVAGGGFGGNSAKPGRFDQNGEYSGPITDEKSNRNLFAQPQQPQITEFFDGKPEDNTDGLQSHTVRNSTRNGSGKQGLPTAEGLAHNPEYAQQQSQAQWGTPLTGQASGLPGPPVVETAERGKDGGLLSLNIGIEVPSESALQEFRYAGNRGAEELGLNFTLVSRQTLNSMRWLFIAIVILLGWFGRDWAFASRLAIGVLGICLPLGLAPLMPPTIMILLDAVLLGTILSIVVWCFDGCFGWCSQGWRCLTKPIGWNRSKQVASMIIFAMGTLAISAEHVSADSKTPAGASPISKPAIPAPPIVGPNLPKIIVPYKNAEDALQANRVLISQDEFMKLWRQANPEQAARATKPGVTSLINEAVYSGSLIQEGDQASIEMTARVVVTNLAKSASQIRLPINNIAVQSATLDGNPAVLSYDQKSKGLLLLVEKQGTFVLDLKFRVAAMTTGTAGRFNVSLNPVATGTLSFEIPENDLLIRVNQSTNTYRLRQDGNKQFAEIAVSQGGQLQVSWEPKLKTNEGLNFVNAEGINVITLDDRGLQLEIGHELKVRQGSMTDVQYTLPENVRLQSISGPDVGGWQVEGNSLKVLLRRKVDDKTTVVLRTYVSVDIGEDDSKIDVPIIAPDSADRDAATLVVTSSGNLSVRSGRVSGLRQVNVSKVNLLTGMTPLKYSPQFMYRTTGQKAALTLLAQRRSTEIQGTLLHGVVIRDRKIRLASRADFVITDAPRASLSFYLPQDYKPLTVKAPHLSDWYIGEDFDSIVIEFDQPQIGRVPIALEGIVPKDADTDFIAIDTPFPLDVARLTSYTAIWNEGAYVPVLDEFVGWRSLAPSSLPKELLKLRPIAPQFAMRSTEPEPDLIAFTLMPARPKLTAESVTLVAISDTSIDYGITLRWNIEQAPVDELSFSLPTWIADRVEFTGEQIRQVIKNDDVDGRTRWNVQLLQPVSGQYLLSAVATLPPSTKGEVRAPRVQFEQLSANGGAAPLTTQQQFVLLVNLSRGQTTINNPADAERVSLVDLPLRVPQQLAIQATDVLKLQSEKEKLSWSVKQFEQQLGAAATINLADILTVIRKDGSWRIKSTYTIKNRNRQFLAIELPADSRLLSVMVNGTPSRAVMAKLKSNSIQLIALPKTSVADTSFQIETVVAGRLPRQLPRWFSIAPMTVSVPMPRVIDKTESERLGIPVLNTRVTVYLPDSVKPMVVTGGSSTNVVPETEGGETRARQRSLLRDAKLLNRVLGDKNYSFAQRETAKNNLKQLGLALHNYNEEGKRFQDEATLSLQSETEKVLEKTRQNFSDYGVVLDQAKQQPTVRFGDNGRTYILDNNDYINANNGTIILNDTSVSGETDETFSFEVQERLTKGKAINKKAAEQGAAKGRSALQKEVLEQNTLLNSRLNELKELDNLQDQQRQMETAPQNFSDMTRRRFKYPEQQQSAGDQQGQSVGIGRREYIPEPSTPLLDTVTRDSYPGNTIVGLANPTQVAPNLDIPFRSGQFANDMDGDGIADSRNASRGGHVMPAEEAGANNYTATSSGWTSSGGLSLPINVPTDGQKMAFTKTGGDAVLTIQLYSEQTVTGGIHGAWLLAWGFAAAVLLGFCCRNWLGRSCCDRWGVALLIVGLAVFLLIPEPFFLLGFVLFCIGTILTAAACCNRRKNLQQLQQA